MSGIVYADSSGAASPSTFAGPEFAQLVARRVAEVRQRIEAARAPGGGSVTLVAVTKTYGTQAVLAAFEAGVSDVGENKVQEAEVKMDAVHVPVRWHLIGHLQRKKAKPAMRFDLIHSIDSVRLAQAVNEAALSAGRVQDVLLQVNVSGEESKGGVPATDVGTVAEALHLCTALRVTGVMTMAPYGAPEPELRAVFGGARTARDVLAARGHPSVTLSMGMSDDYEVAVQEGATMVRLGTVLFGPRALS